MKLNVSDDNVTLYINDINAILATEVEIPIGVVTDDTQAVLHVSEETPVSFTVQESGGTVLPPKYNGSYAFTPTGQTQTIETNNKWLTKNITIAPIPNNYGLITYNGSSITVS